MMATLYTVLINAGNGRRLSDGVERATVPASHLFPYLQPPDAVRADELPINPSSRARSTASRRLSVERHRRRGGRAGPRRWSSRLGDTGAAGQSVQRGPRRRTAAPPIAEQDAERPSCAMRPDRTPDTITQNG